MQAIRFVGAGLVLVVSVAGARALEVHKSATVAGTPEAVWEKIGAFCGINDWHPAVEACDLSEEGGATYQTLTLPDGATIKEKLVEETATSYTYEIVESPLPVANYNSTISVTADGDGTMVRLAGQLRRQGCARRRRRGRHRRDLSGRTRRNRENGGKLIGRIRPPPLPFRSPRPRGGRGRRRPSPPCRGRRIR